jgi:hypothetical protein
MICVGRLKTADNTSSGFEVALFYETGGRSTQLVTSPLKF